MEVWFWLAGIGVVWLVWWFGDSSKWTAMATYPRVPSLRVSWGIPLGGRHRTPVKKP